MPTVRDEPKRERDKAFAFLLFWKKTATLRRQRRVIIQPGASNRRACCLSAVARRPGYAGTQAVPAKTVSKLLIETNG
jgi:hypothetical protein